MHIGIDGSRCFEPQATGVERYARLLVPQLVTYLGERGHRVTVYTRGDVPPDIPPMVVQRLPLRRLWTQAALGPRARADRVDCLFVPAHVLPFIRPRHAVAVVHDVCWEAAPDAYTFRQRWYLRTTTAEATRHARVITHAEATRRALLTIYRAPEEAITVIPPAPPPVAASTARVPWASPYLLYIGGFHERKNVTTLLRAYAELLRLHPTTREQLVLLGDTRGRSAARLLAFIASLPCRARIHAVGYVPDALRDAALVLARAVVVPSLCEGSSLVLLEARVARTPFVASDLPACRDAGGMAGLYVSPPDDVRAWTHALHDLLAHPTAPTPPPARTWADVAADVSAVILSASAGYVP